MSRERPFSQGKLLLTRTVLAHFSEKEIEEADYIEKCMVFKNFSSIDDGRSRIFIGRYDTPRQAYLESCRLNNEHELNCL